MKHISFLLLFLIGSLSMASGQQVRGVLTDIDNDPVPYAKVYVENSTYGVVTNVKGEYFLELEKGSYNLVFSSLSYKTKSVKVVVNGTAQVIDVVLEPDDIEMETVTLTAGRKDPAYAIMEKVIKNKKEYIQQFTSYRCETYLKASLEVDTLVKKKKNALPDSLTAKKEKKTKPNRLAEKKERKKDKDSTATERSEDGPKIGNKAAERPRLNFIESQSTTYFEYANRYKSVVHAYRDFSQKKSGGSSISIGDGGMDVSNYETETNNPYLFYLDVSDADFNFYKNLISIPKLADKPFVSPLSSTSWRLTYKYHLEESFYEDGHVIHKINITPRNSQGPFFYGDIFIEDESFAIKSVNLQILPTTLNYFNYFQVLHNYERTGDGRWSLAREDYYYNVKDGKIRYYGNTIALHTEYQLDVEHPRNFFRNELRRVEQQAFEHDSLYWEEQRPITLKKAEIDFIKVQDSIDRYHHSAEYLRQQDSTYNRLKIWDFLLTGVGFKDRRHGMQYFFNPIIAQIRPLGVGGYRHALGGNISKTWTKYTRLGLSGELDYGVKNKDLKGYAKLRYTYNPKHFARAYIKYGNRYTMINFNQSIATVFSRSNYIQKRYYGIGHEFEVVNGLYLDVEGEFADRQAIQDIELEQWSQDLFGSTNAPRVFDPYREALLTMRVKFVPGQKYQTEPYRKVIVGSIWPVFELTYKKSIPGIWKSEMNFDFVQLHVTDEMRLGTMGLSRWSAYAGSFLQKNNVQFTDYKFFRGGDTYFFSNPLATFQNLDTTLSTTRPYVQVNYLHDFAGSLINKIPLLKRTPLQITGGAGALYIEEIDFFHAEIYGGLQIPFRIKQQRFKIGGYYATSFSNYSGAVDGQLKIGITFFDSYNNRWTY